MKLNTKNSFFFFFYLTWLLWHKAQATDDVFVGKNTVKDFMPSFFDILQ